MPAPTVIFGSNLKWHIGRSSNAYSDTGGTTPAVDGGSVARINDLSGGGINFTQGTGSKQPTLDADSINSRRAFVLNGSSNYMTAGDVLDATLTGASKQWLMFAAFRLRSATGSHTIIAKHSTGTIGYDGRSLFWRVTDGYPELHWYPNLTNGGITRRVKGTRAIAQDEVVLLAVHYNGTATTSTGVDRVTMWINGARMPAYLATNLGALGDPVDSGAHLTIGAFSNSTGGTGSGFASIDLAEAGIVSGAVTDAQMAQLFDHLSSEWGVGLDEEHRADFFLDSAEIATNSGLTLAQSALSRYPGNPVIGSDDFTWDYSIHWIDVHHWGPQDWGAYGVVLDDSGSAAVRETYYTSEDGLDWGQPNLGLISYGGSTANNIISDGGNPSIIHDPTAPSSRRYVNATATHAGTNGVFIYVGTSRTSFTYNQTLALSAAGAYREAKSLTRLADGRWAIWYTTGHDESTGRRKTGFYLSDTTDPTGTWADMGIVMPTSDADDQKYGLGVQRITDTYWLGFVPHYVKSTEQMAMDLYVSRNQGSSWTLVKHDWLPLGSTGQFDDEMIIIGKSLIRAGYIHRYYYTGSPVNHASSHPFGMRVGLATAGYRRLGSISGTGHVITRAFVAPKHLVFNADASAGSLKIEVLDATDDSVIAGYAQSDFTAFSGNSFERMARWGSNVRLPEGDFIKLKFYLTSATLYSWEVGQGLTLPAILHHSLRRMV